MVVVQLTRRLLDHRMLEQEMASNLSLASV